MIRNLRNGRTGIAILGMTSLITGVALAQPDINEQPLRENPKYTRRNNRANQAEVRARREKQNKERRENNIRNILTSYGFAEAPLQEAVIAHLAVREKLSLEIKAAGNQLARSLRARPVDDTQVRALLVNYRTVLKNAQEQEIGADRALDAKIKYSSNVRLEAVLELMGAIGEMSN